jgi:hypothetical protein
VSYSEEWYDPADRQRDTEPSPFRPDRPGGVSAVIVLTWIGIVLSAVAILMLTVLVSSADPGAVTPLVIFLLILSIVMLAGNIVLVIFLARGYPTARTIYTVVAVIGIPVNLVREGLNAVFVIGLLVTIICLILLFTSRSTEFFEDSADYRSVTGHR